MNELLTLIFFGRKFSISLFNKRLNINIYTFVYLHKKTLACPAPTWD